MSGYSEKIEVKEIEQSKVREESPFTKKKIFLKLMNFHKYVGKGVRLYIYWDQFKTGFEYREAILGHFRSYNGLYKRLRTAPQNYGVLFFQQGMGAPRYIGFGADPKAAYATYDRGLVIDENARFFWATYHKWYH